MTSNILSAFSTTFYILKNILKSLKCCTSTATTYVSKTIHIMNTAGILLNKNLYFLIHITCELDQSKQATSSSVLTYKTFAQTSSSISYEHLIKIQVKKGQFNLLFQRTGRLHADYCHCLEAASHVMTLMTPYISTYISDLYVH